MPLLLAIGTRKGLFLARSNADQGRAGGDVSWSLDGPEFLMREVPSVGFLPPPDSSGSPGLPRLLVGVRSEHWGPTVARSDDLGKTWAETEHGSIQFGAESGASLERVWQLQADPARPGVVWAGCEPTSLWHSTDYGETFDLVSALWEHPHRPQWFPGFGGAAVHTVITDPADEAKVLVAMSTGGVYASADAGASWVPRNKGITASFMPDPYPEFGQCVHKVTADASGPTRLYAQNHGGVFRSDDAGLSWTSIAGGLPADFGFTILAHPRRPGVAWVVPLEADARRIPPKGRMQLHRTEDAGESWQEVGAGLPEGAWTVVLRDAGCVLDRGDDVPPLLALGTRDGSVYVSLDEGDTMTQVAAHLPDVLSLRAALVP